MRRSSYLTPGERIRFAFIVCVFALVALLAHGCAWSQHTVTRVESSHSVYKIAIEIDEDVGVRRGSGTGWVIARAHGQSYVLTAGHVCETRKHVMNPDPLGLGDGQAATVESTTYKIIAASGYEYGNVKVVLDDDNVDLCLLSIPGDFGAPLPLAARDPEYGARGWYIGAPFGLWGNGIAGIYEVTYAGRGSPFKGGCDGVEKGACDNSAEVFSTAEAAPGASGSPVLVGGEVVADLNMVDGEFQTFAIGVPWDTIRAFMARAHI